MAVPPDLFLAYHAVLSVFTFLTYGWDKRAASRRGARRVPEARLHLFALLGGWPGAWAARSWLRHKSAQNSFTLGLAGVTLLHLGAVAAAGYAGWIGG